MVIEWTILGCIILLLLLIGSGALKKLGKLILRGGIGALCIYITNFLIAPFIGVSIGVNFLTAFIVGVLGIPGFFMLYIVNWIL